MSLKSICLLGLPLVWGLSIRHAAAQTTPEAGAAAETAARCLRVGPGLAAPVLIAYGSWLAWEPLGFIVLGAFLLLADRRIS